MLNAEARHPTWLPTALVVVAVLFAYLLVAPVLEPGHNRAGDDPIHIAYEEELNHIVSAGHQPFGWSYLYGVGAPIFVFRPPLFYYAVVALHRVSFGLLPLSVAHKAVIVLALCLFPLCVYRGLQRLDLTRLEAAAAALLALLPISTFGHTLDAYFSLGLAKQLLAITLFPVVLGAGHAAVTGRGSPVAAGLWAALAFLSHPYVGFCLFLVLGLDVLLVGLGRGCPAGARGALRLLPLALVLVGATAFYTVPMYSSPEIQRVGGYTGSWRSGFEVVCETAARTLSHFLNGALLDSTRAGRYGGGEWGWHDNAAHFRPPVLSWLALVGWCLVLWRARRPGLALLAAALPAALLFLSGPDDVHELAWIPFQNQFQYLHAIFLLEFVAVALGGVALGTLMIRAADLADRVRANSSVRAWRAPLTALATAAIVLAFPWRERFLYSTRVVDTMPFDARNGQVGAAGAPLGGVDRDYAACIDYLNRRPSLERMYGAPAGDADPLEVFYLNLAPALVDQTNVISGFFGVEAGGANFILNEYFRRPMAGSPNLLRLFDVRFLLAHRSNEPQFAPLGNTTATVIRNDSWVLQRTRGNYNAFDYARVKPVLVFASPGAWEGCCREWLASYADMPFAEALPWLVRADDLHPGRTPLDPERFAAVFLVDPQFGDATERAAAFRRLDAYRAGGGVVMTLRQVPGLEARAVGDGAWILDDAVLQGVGHEAELTETAREREHHGMQYTSAREHLFLLKNAFYRGWHVTVDGRPTPLLNVSPGFVGFFGPAGTHQVSVRYRGANGQGVGLLLSSLTLLGSLVWLLRCRARRAAAPTAELRVAA